MITIHKLAANRELNHASNATGNARTGTTIRENSKNVLILPAKTSKPPENLSDKQAAIKQLMARAIYRYCDRVGDMPHCNRRRMLLDVREHAKYFVALFNLITREFLQALGAEGFHCE